MKTIKIGDKDFNIIDKYMFNEKDELGCGAFGSVYKGYLTVKKDNEESKPVAIKRSEFVTDDMEQLGSIRSEIIALNHLTHPNIVKLYKYVKIKTNVYMVTEFAGDGDLVYYYKKNVD